MKRITLLLVLCAMIPGLVLAAGSKSNTERASRRRAL